MWQLAIPLGVIAAAGAAGEIPAPWNYVLNYGIVAIVLMMVVSQKFLVPAWTLAASEARTAAAIVERDAERSARNDLELTVRDKYVPSLEAARVSQESMLRYLQQRTGAAT